MNYCNYDSKYLKIRKQLAVTGFDEYYQAGNPTRFSKMNVCAESRVLNKRYWICIDGGYQTAEVYYIAFRALDNSNEPSQRIYCKNQDDVVDELKKIQEQISEKTKMIGANGRRASNES